ECALDSILIVEPRPKDVLVIKAVDETQPELIHSIGRQRVRLTEHDLPGGEIDETLLVGWRRKRGGKMILTPALRNPREHGVPCAKAVIAAEAVLIAADGLLRVVEKIPNSPGKIGLRIQRQQLPGHWIPAVHGNSVVRKCRFRQ